MPRSGPRESSTVRVFAAAYVPLEILAVWAVASRLGGSRVSPWLLIPAIGWLVIAAIVAAGLAAHALLRRRWGWAALLVVGWPLTAPVYLVRCFTPT